MATEKEANLGREQFSDYLRKLGAHSIAVDVLKGTRGKSFAIVAYFDKRHAQAVPQTLKVKIGSRTLDVPLVIGIMKRPSPE